MNRVSHVIIVLCLLISSVSIADPIYKWFDSKGQTHYGSAPPQGTEAKKIDTYGPSSDSAAEIAAHETAAAKNTEQKMAQGKDTPPTPKDDPQAKQEACKQALNEYDQLNNTSHISVTNENGEQEIMEEGQRQTLLREIQNKINTNCSQQ